MTEKKVKIGVIGVGHLGRFHAKLYKEVASAELVGVYDSDQERAKQIASEFSVKNFNSVEELLNSVDGVSIVTSTRFHYETAKTAIEHGCHIFVEKPVTATVEQAKELVRLAEEKNLIFQVGHIERFNPALMALEGIAINPVFIEVHRLAGFTPRGADVAVVLDLMIHDIDLVLSFVKHPIEKLSASGAAVISDTEDIANCRIEFANGSVANLTASRISAKKMRKMRIFQKNAYFSIDFGEGETEVFHTSELKLNGAVADKTALSLGNIDAASKATEIHYTKLSRPEVNALKLECEQFADSIRRDKQPVVSGIDGLKALEVANMILEEMSGHRNKISLNFS
jgi:predicted dehydrogenase